MPTNNPIANHYLHGDLLQSIESALPALGKTTETVTVADLAPVDEFHIGGRIATDHLFEQLSFSEQSYLLDVGCGLGGAARYVTTKYKNRVAGIDLTPEYIETGNAICRWMNLENSIELLEGSALSMPYQSNSFDGSYMFHVGMNIKDKAALFSELARVLKPGSGFGVYDIMRRTDEAIVFPVPWATDSSTSHIDSAKAYQELLEAAGFEISVITSRGDFALKFFKQLSAKSKANGGPPPLGLHTLMQEGTANKIKNMVDNIANGIIEPVEIIARLK